MRPHYRRRSYSSWFFWTALIVGGTVYAAHQFDWLPIVFLSPNDGPSEGTDDAVSAAAAGDGTEPAAGQSPPGGTIQVSQSSVGPQSEPPNGFDDSGPAPRALAGRSAKSRLLEQRAEGVKPRVRANSITPSTVEPANIDDLDVHRPAFAGDASSPRSQGNGDRVTQASDATERNEPAPVDPALAAKLEVIDRQLQSNDVLAAHREMSTLYWSKPQWRSEIKERIEKTARTIYFDPETHFLDPYTVKTNDQFAQFARKYNVPWQYLAKLNRIDPQRIRPGQRLKVIKGPFSAIVELDGYLLTVHAYGYFVRAYPIGVGKDGSTPIGRFTVANKVTNPQYTDPQGRVIDSDDPGNPLGERWIDLGGGYGIHGTIEPESIGKAASRGCIRMRNEDVAEVFDMLGVGSDVTIRR